ncbi:MAG: putative sulfate exporter family transporter [Candidatus Magnetominusculus sp. LBB02]|nr:putative sulfate exporter family transporter [Candidatus Magnetominusculus sp. LBB02]
MNEKTAGLSEDWLALFLGIFVFVMSLGLFAGSDLMGWGVSTSIWTDPTKAMSAVSAKYQPVKGEITKMDGAKITLKLADGKETVVTAEGGISTIKTGDMYEKKGVSGIAALFFTYAAMLCLMIVGAMLMRLNVGKFAVGFTVIFWISYLCWLLGNNAYIAATKNQLAGFKINWALSLTGESGFVIALIAGLIVGNFFPKLSEALKEAAKPELYIKTAIVIMGAMLGLKAAESFTLASAVLFRGFCAIVEAYLIYWAVVYYVARKYFKFSPEWAAPLAAGISICGVSAAIAVGGAIRSRPIVPIMVSSLVVIFAVVEMLILPFAAQIFLWSEPLVAGAWMGLAVKTDGGAVASGAITDALIRSKALEMSGVNYEAGWITMASTTVKMFIDVFIGVWAFVLAVVWCTKIECKPGETPKAVEIWQRFPKFVIGYVVTFLLLLFICFPSTKAVAPVDSQIKGLTKEISSLEKKLTSNPADEASIKSKIAESKDKIKSLNGSVKDQRGVLAKAKLATDESNTFRVMFFVLTFFTIGLVSNFKKLWEEGIGRLAVVYVVCLFGFIIWVGLFISWLFFNGVKPPVITG